MLEQWWQVIWGAGFYLRGASSYGEKDTNNFKTHDSIELCQAVFVDRAQTIGITGIQVPNPKTGHVDIDDMRHIET